MNIEPRHGKRSESPGYRYSFVELNPIAGMTYNKLYVDAFIRGLNEGDWLQHRVTEGQESQVDTHGWSYGLPPRYHDGRVTSRRCSWVYAKRASQMPEGACALVYFTTEEEPIGYLIREA